MDLAQFRKSLASAAPDAQWSAPLKALWWAGKGDWDRAHKIVQDDEGADAAWVHAYLHRVEGDLPNARYWYRQAGRAEAEVTTDAEWENLVNEFIAE